MDKNVKDADRVGAAENRSKADERGAPLDGKSEQPAQEIADDEVEIAKTGTSPERTAGR
jgi:hypothetical protein